MNELIPFVEFEGSTATRYRLRVSLTQEAHALVRVHCDANGLHYLAFYRETFDLGLRALLVAAGAINGAVEKRLPSGAPTESGAPREPTTPGKTTLDDDRKATEAYRRATRGE